MKRILALILATILAFGSVCALAETNDTPPESPSGEMGQPPEGGTGGNPPDGMGEPPQGGPVMGGPGGSAEKAEGVIGSWSSGGSATYTALEAGKTYELKNSSGDTTATYTATEDKATEIHSDIFGFMAHQGNNSMTVEKGTVVDSGYATFLVKSGFAIETLTATVDEAIITNGGVLIQVMDNDDTTNGGMMDADDPENTNGGYAFDDAEEAAVFAGQYQNTSFTIEEYWSIGQVAQLQPQADLPCRLSRTSLRTMAATIPSSASVTRAVPPFSDNRCMYSLPDTF